MSGKQSRSGGKRPGSGRKVGTPNKVTADLKKLTLQYVPKAVAKLEWLIDNGETHQVQAMACREIIDRAHGKPSQVLAGDPDNPLIPSKIEQVIVDPKS
jgi:hypothetical protein